MELIGYARVSSLDQDCAIQEAALRAAGCTRIRSEKRTGTTTEGRTELAALLEDVLRPGDTLVVTRIDRLARSLFDLEKIVRALSEKRVGLKAIEQPVDTTTPAGRAFIQMLGVFAEFETALRRERQLEGIAKAKADDQHRPRDKRKFRGRQPTALAKAADVKRLAAEGVGPSEIAEQLGLGRTSVWRILKGGADDG